MRDFAFIGRDKPSKGLRYLIEIFSQLEESETKLHVFSDFVGINTPNVIYHGWVSPCDIWRVGFDYVILPMFAPETFCFSLHDAIANKRGVIVNGHNDSLCSQIPADTYKYYNDRELLMHINRLAKETVEVVIPQVTRRKTLWHRLRNRSCNIKTGAT